MSKVKDELSKELQKESSKQLWLCLEDGECLVSSKSFVENFDRYIDDVVNHSDIIVMKDSNPGGVFISIDRYENFKKVLEIAEHHEIYQSIKDRISDSPTVSDMPTVSDEPTIPTVPTVSLSDCKKMFAD